MADRRSGTRLRNTAIIVLLLALVFAGFAAFRAGPSPQITIEAELPGIGRRTPVHIAVAEPKRGLSKVSVQFLQGERVEVLEERLYVPLDPWQFWGQRTPSDDITVEVGRETLQGLEEGKATIRVVAERVGGWLRFPRPGLEQLLLEVKLRPPQIQVLSRHTYVAQGGSEVVIYKVGGTSVRDGVQAGDWWFPGFPLPGGDTGERFALFSAPYDLDDHEQISLQAYDDVENGSRVSFVDRFFGKPLSHDTIRLSDSFMGRVVPAILDQSPEVQGQGDLLQDYLMINGELRGKNNALLVEMAAASRPEFLWTRRFLQVRNAKVMSRFADRRTYVHEGREVDQQDHLGFDLASTQRAEIQASNNGVVMLARYFGIYGNSVVLDHGYGLMSLYGHLSQIEVQAGQEVQRGDVIGRSGQTGLAGGDHLHFTMLLHGLPVSPEEWWDGHWIHDRLKLKLGPGLTFDG